MSITEETNKKKGITHIVGTFLISAHGAFLNGAGTDPSLENKTTTIPKQFSDGKHKVPYVSAQAWRRWLRNTLIEETGWEQSKLQAIKLSKKGTTNKIAGHLNPIDYCEDDLFGYMRAEEGQGKNKNDESQMIEESLESEESSENNEPPEKQNNVKVKSLVRASPFASSILISLRKFGWKGLDKGYVHLEEGTPVPYSTVFYNTNLQGIFGLDLSRVGVFNNIGDRIELNQDLVKTGLESKKLVEIEKGKYSLSDKNLKNIRAAELLKALSIMRGGSKQAAFATDVSPKVIILAGLNCGNLVFNHLFEDNPDQLSSEGPLIKTDTLKEIAVDYKDRLTTPIYIGIRKGHLDSRNEELVRELEKSKDPKFVVGTPPEVIKKFVDIHLKI
jgi:CRISPR-associated protein Cst2